MIARNPSAAAQETFDAVIIGGGFYGATLFLEASRRGLRTLLLERADFGAATSFNSLRIIHGGLRYLQSLDLRRFRESVNERRWFLKNFPQLVMPLPCLMPLDGGDVRKRFMLRAGLTLNDILSWRRNVSMASEQIIPPGKILNREETERLFPDVSRSQQIGSALWYDAHVPNSQRLLIEIIRWACRLGGTALNYVEASELRKSANRVDAVTAIDREDGRTYEFATPIVVNATGPASRLLARQFDRDIPGLFKPSIGWNVLFNRPALSTHAVAVTSHRRHKHTYFLVPWKGMLLVGTGHGPWIGPPQQPRLPRTLLTEFVEDINSIVPNLELRLKDALRVLIGFLPSTHEGGATNPTRETIVDHGSHGGPLGFYSVSGVKFTTSRMVAEKTLNRIFPRRQTSHRSDSPSNGSMTIGCVDYDWMPAPDDASWTSFLIRPVQEESVLHLSDLVFRRTSLGDNPTRARTLAPRLCEMFSWDKQRRMKEIDAIEESLDIEKLLM